MDLIHSQTGLARLFGGYSLVAGLVWILRDPGSAWAGPLAGLHLCLGVLLLNIGPRRGMVPLSWGLWLLAWTEIGWLYRLTEPVVHDGALVLHTRDVGAHEQRIELGHGHSPEMTTSPSSSGPGDLGRPSRGEPRRAVQHRI